ncbi:uncharacterized protein LOC132076108 [Ammospiza nelsoni]|uniref:uncharacterized protein LOC132076108 n=1 Tax=Ammospiza nelsoni TaxID=2857394 RepID=UPI00286C0CCA|nr:uncharacterized protein LOC132076108 [Ammospiza nelsoni]
MAKCSDVSGLKVFAVWAVAELGGGSSPGGTAVGAAPARGSLRSEATAVRAGGFWRTPSGSCPGPAAAGSSLSRGEAAASRAGPAVDLGRRGRRQERRGHTVGRLWGRGRPARYGRTAAGSAPQGRSPVTAAGNGCDPRGGIWSDRAGEDFGTKADRLQAPPAFRCVFHCPCPGCSSSLLRPTGAASRGLGLFSSFSGVEPFFSAWIFRDRTKKTLSAAPPQARRSRQHLESDHRIFGPTSRADTEAQSHLPAAGPPDISRRFIP